MIAAIAAWAGKSVLMQSPIGAALKAVPRKIWILLAIVAAIAVAVIWHGRQVKAFGDRQFAAGYEQRKTEEKAAADKRATRDAAITAPIRRKTDETISDINRRAGAMRLRGAGAASCVNTAPAAAGGHEPGSGQAAAPVVPMPDQERVELIALPFAAAVTGAAICDANLAELKAWREQRAALEADRAKEGN